MDRRKFIASALSVPVVLQFPFGKKKPVTINHFYRGEHIIFQGNGDKVIATIRGRDRELGLITISGNGNLSLDRWFEHGPYLMGPSTINPKWIDYPDNRRLDTLKFVMKTTIDKILS